VSAAVIGHPDGPATTLAAGLRTLDLKVTEYAPAARAELAAQLRAEAPSLVVWAPAPGAAATRRSLVELSPQEWEALAAEPLREAVACFQAAFDVMRTGAVVALLPTIAMNGSAGLCAWASAAEGVRSLVKVSAREVAPRGITVNAVAVPAQDLARTSESLNRPGLPPARLPLGDPAGIVAALGAPPWNAVTGATIAVDGGVWMPA
jgi:NAD(P)-dependent dehydrogenase (short-subunit alcohol dehydrogenase family)